MNPGLFVLLFAFLVALGVLALELVRNRPVEGWFSWTREAFAAKNDDADLDAEPLDMTLSEVFEEAEEGSGYTTLHELVRG